jgi:4-amino-4-deoxy-L-arabinose transferase-like glycosyltransferase
MENDSAQHAVMAMRMLQDHNFLELYRGDFEYLDKPHLHFWLSGLSMKVFGINHIAYRIPALLFTCLGAYSTFKLTSHWYKNNYGHLATFVFLSTQAIILSNHDVRTDAVLTGATIFGLWQLVLYIDKLKIGNLLLGTLGVAMAFMSKGQLGVFVVSICLLVYLLPHPNLKIILKSPITYLVIPVFFLCISPVLYAYHHQFGNEGISFILWNQSTNRLTGEGFSGGNTDYSFFFHTILWAFLPWSLLFYAHLFDRFRKLITYKGIYVKQNMTSIGILIILVVISFSSSKLPHYLNSLFPIMSIGVASYLYRLEKRDNRSALKVMWKFRTRKTYNN